MASLFQRIRYDNTLGHNFDDCKKKLNLKCSYYCENNTYT